MAVLTDPAECGPVTLAFCQDVQAEAYDYPAIVLRRTRASPAPPGPGRARTRRGGRGAARARRSRSSSAAAACSIPRRRRSCIAFCEKHGIPVAETQAGKSATPADHPLHIGAIGVTGTGAANAPRRRGRRRCSPSARGSPISPPAPGRCSRTRTAASSASTSQPFDAVKHRALPLVADAQAGPRRARRARSATGARPRPGPSSRAKREAANGSAIAARYLAPTNAALPTDAQVLGALMRVRRAERHRRLRRRRPARRTAQAVAGGRAARLPPRIRLFLHGLRDRRRPRRQDRASRPRSDRRRRRRLLSDDEFGDRDLGDARPAS